MVHLLATAFEVALVVPFVYLTCLAAAYSSYVHNNRVPSRAFVVAFAAPSNEMVKLPCIGGVYSNYFRLCLKVTSGTQTRNSTGL